MLPSHTKTQQLQEWGIPENEEITLYSSSAIGERHWNW